jgi:hypothetical protein
MPQSPRQILESLTLLKMSSDFSADLPSFGQGLGVAEVGEGYEGFIAFEFEDEAVAHLVGWIGAEIGIVVGVCWIGRLEGGLGSPLVLGRK